MNLLRPVPLVVMLNLAILLTILTVRLQDVGRLLAFEAVSPDRLTVDDYVLGVSRDLATRAPGLGITRQQARRLLSRAEVVRAGLLGLPGVEHKTLALFEATLSARQARHIRDAAWRRKPRAIEPERALSDFYAALASR